MCPEVVVVAKLGRNETCRCGSGRKLKHCCGHHRGPSPDALARQRLRDLARKLAPLLADEHGLDLYQLLGQVIELPVRHLSLQVRLPRIFPPELEQLRADIEDGTGDLVDSVLEATQAIDGPQLRLALATRAAELCRDDLIDVESFAVIVIDLARPTSLFVSASLIAAIAVNLGRCATPAGLLVAAS